MKVEPRTLWKAIVEEATHTREGESLPSSWRWARVGDIGRIVGGGTPNTKRPEYWADGSISWITPLDMSKQRTQMYISHGERNITPEGLAKSSARLIPKGSVIMSSRAPIGYLAIAANELCTSQGCKSVLPSDDVLPEYLYYALTARIRDIKNMGRGTTFAEIPGKLFATVIIPLPPIDEQREIVARLEPLLREVEELDEHYQRYKHAKEVFRKAAIQAAVHAKDEELPAGWRWVRLGEVCTMTNGRAFKPSEWSKEGLPIVRIQNLNNPREEYHYFAGDVKSCHLLEGRELLFAWSASIGVYVWNGGNAVLNQHIFKVEANDMTMNGYIRYVLEAQLLKIKNLTHGTTMKHIRKCTLESIPFPLPPIDQQLHIVSYLDNLTHQLDIIS